MAFILIPLMTVVAYLLGSLSAAIIVSRYFGMEDPRTYGSGNPGASNMLRSGRKDAAALTLLGDALKGLVAVWLAMGLRSLFDMGDGIVAMAGLAVVIGHMWPLFFNFKGGKGVATALGVILGMSLWVTFWALAIWLVIAFKFKKSSLAALVAAAIAPFISFIVQIPHPKLSWSLFFISALVLYRHKDNIKRLMAGNELGIGQTAKPLKDGKVQTHDESLIMEGTSSSELEAIKEELANAEEFILPTQHDLENSKQQIKETVEHVVETTKELAQEAVENVKETVEITVEQHQHDLENSKQQIKETVEHVVETTKELAQETVENVKETVEITVEQHQHDLENSKQQIKETVEHVVETTKELAQEAIENIKETVEITKAEIDNAIEKQDAKVKSDIQNLSTPEATTTKSKNTRKKK